MVSLIRQGGNHLVMKVVSVSRKPESEEVVRKKGRCGLPGGSGAVALPERSGVCGRAGARTRGGAGGREGARGKIGLSWAWMPGLAGAATPGRGWEGNGVGQRGGCQPGAPRARRVGLWDMAAPSWHRGCMRSARPDPAPPREEPRGGPQPVCRKQRPPHRGWRGERPRTVGVMELPLLSVGWSRWRTVPVGLALEPAAAQGVPAWGLCSAGPALGLPRGLGGTARARAAGRG